MDDTRPLALVTGASSGIGLELAKQFAGHGYDVLVNAEDDRLASAAAEVRRLGAGVTEVQADLRTTDGVHEVHAAVLAQGRPLDAAALNAGVGHGARFVEQDLSTLLEVVDVNVRSTVHLAHLVLTDMVARGSGRVLVTSSVAATMPGPYQSVYNASKSFLQSLTEALQDELRDTGVTVTALMPGPTATDFFRRAGLLDSWLGRGPHDDPADVAEQAYRGLVNGDRQVVASSLMSRAMTVANAVTPDRVKAVASRVMAKPRS